MDENWGMRIRNWPNPPIRINRKSQKPPNYCSELSNMANLPRFFFTCYHHGWPHLRHMFNALDPPHPMFLDFFRPAFCERPDSTPGSPGSTTSIFAPWFPQCFPPIFLSCRHSSSPHFGTAPSNSTDFTSLCRSRIPKASQALCASPYFSVRIFTERSSEELNGAGRSSSTAEKAFLSRKTAMMTKAFWDFWEKPEGWVQTWPQPLEQQRCPTFPALSQSELEAHSSTQSPMESLSKGGQPGSETAVTAGWWWSSVQSSVHNQHFSITDGSAKNNRSTQWLDPAEMLWYWRGTWFHGLDGFPTDVKHFFIKLEDESWGVGARFSDTRLCLRCWINTGRVWHTTLVIQPDWMQKKGVATNQKDAIYGCWSHHPLLVSFFPPPKPIIVLRVC